MASPKMAMSREEILARIQAGAENQNQPELSPELADKIRASLASKAGKGWDLPVIQKAADPEAVANSRIEAAAPMMKPRPVQFGNPQPQPRIPESLAPQEDLPEMPENPTEDEQSKMNRLMWLKQKAQGQ